MKTLTQIRTDRKLRLDDVQASTGVPISTVSRVERGQIPRTHGRAIALAGFYGLGLPDFYAAVAAGAAQDEPLEEANAA